MGIVFDTQESEGLIVVKALHFPLVMGIVFDTRESGGIVVYGYSAPLIAGYRFRYP